MATFGQLLKQFRVAKGREAKQIYTQLGYHRNTYSKWENGHQLPNRDTVLTLSKILQLQPAQHTALLRAAGYVEEEAVLDPGSPLPSAASYQPGQEHSPDIYRTSVFRMVEDYTDIFGGREQELHTLNTFLEHETQRTALLLAPTGLGKTALLIHWVAHVQKRAEWTVVFVPISRRYQTATADVALGMLAYALANYHDERAKFQTYNTSPDQLRPIIADYFRRRPPGQQRLLVVIDALDEAVGWSVGRDLFPRTIGSHLKLLVSARQMADKTREQWLEDLGWRSTVDIHLSPLSQPSVADILEQLGKPLDRLATDVNLLAEIQRVSQGDPLTIRLLIEALRDGSLTPGNLTHMPPGLEAYVQSWIKELREHSKQMQEVYTLLGLCATALGPLTSVDLQQLAPDVFHRQLDLSGAVEVVARFLIGNGKEEQGYVFSHPRLREIFLEQVISERECIAFHERFVGYGASWYANQSQPLSTYLRHFWIAHLKAKDDWQQMRTVLTEIVPMDLNHNQPWAEARYTAEGNYAGYLSDLDLLWQWAEQTHNLNLCFRCTLIASSIRSLSSNLDPALLLDLVKTGTPAGRWSIAAAVRHIQQMLSAKQQVEAIKLLVEVGLTEEDRILLLDAARTIGDSAGRAHALSIMVSHPGNGHEAVLQEALNAARAIKDAADHAQALSALVPHSGNQQVAILHEILTSVRTIQAPWARTQVLIAIAPHLPPNLILSVLDIARSILDSEYHGQVLRALTPKLPPTLLPTVLDMARTILDSRTRTEALSALAPRTGNKQVAVLHEALAATGMIKDPWPRVDMIRILAPLLPPDLFSDAIAVARAIPDPRACAQALCILTAYAGNQQTTVFQEALETARTIQDARERTEALIALISYAGDHHLAVLREALDTIHTIKDGGSRGEALIALAPYAGNQQPLILTEALDIICASSDSEYRAQALRALVPHLPPSLLLTALNAARDIPDAEYRAHTLCTLAPLLENLEDIVLREALDAARAIKVPSICASTLKTIAPLLPPNLRPDALAVARTIPDTRACAQALHTLAAHAGNQQATVLGEALDATRAIQDFREHAQALIALAPYAGNQHEEILRETLTLIRTIHDSEGRAQALSNVAPVLPSNLLLDALAITRTLETFWHRAQALSALAPYLPLNLLLSNLDIARGITSAKIRALVLIALAPYAGDQHETILREVLDIIHTIQNPGARSQVLRALAPVLLSNLLPDTLAIARTIEESTARVQTLVALAPYAGNQQVTVLREVLDAVRIIENAETCARVLSAIAPHLNPDLMTIAFDVACTIEESWIRCQSLISLAPHAESQQSIVVSAALATARNVEDTDIRAQLLASLVPHAGTQQSVVLREALMTARNVEDTDIRAQLLASLVPNAGTQQSVVLREALMTARNVANTEARTQLLIDLVPHAGTQQSVVLHEALATAHNVVQQATRAQLLVSLVPQLTSELIPLVLEAACDIENIETRAEVLTVLVQHLTEDISHEQTLRVLVTYGRPGFLSSIAVLMPWLLQGADEDRIKEFLLSIHDVERYWP